MNKERIRLLNMFNEEYRNKHIFHIPHSSINIVDNYNFTNYDNELVKLTDWAVDLIFQVDGVDRIVTEFSRLFCDVERYSNDELEIMNKVGRGFYYTKSDSGEELRKLDITHKEYVKKNYYYKHHQKLEDLIAYKLSQYNECFIIDCHSFNNIPLETDINQEINRPNINLGINDNYNENLLNSLLTFFNNENLTVKINEPYSGSILPHLYENNENVKTIMIEINKNLYMKDDYINTNKVIQLNKLINKYFNQ